MVRECGKGRSRSGGVTRRGRPTNESPVESTGRGGHLGQRRSHVKAGANTAGGRSSTRAANADLVQSYRRATPACDGRCGYRVIRNTPLLWRAHDRDLALSPGSWASPADREHRTAGGEAQRKVLEASREPAASCGEDIRRDVEVPRGTTLHPPWRVYDVFGNGQTRSSTRSTVITVAHHRDAAQLQPLLSQTATAWRDVTANDIATAMRCNRL